MWPSLLQTAEFMEMHLSNQIPRRPLLTANRVDNKCLQTWLQLRPSAHSIQPVNDQYCIAKYIQGVRRNNVELNAYTPTSLKTPIAHTHTDIHGVHNMDDTFSPLISQWEQPHPDGIFWLRSNDTQNEQQKQLKPKIDRNYIGIYMVDVDRLAFRHTTSSFTVRINLSNWHG